LRQRTVVSGQRRGASFLLTYAITLLRDSQFLFVEDLGLLNGALNGVEGCRAGQRAGLFFS